ncbi:MAG: hypothetical protein COW30_14730 [Rhodospirillales bacterium CG15_BIG_FIL_POST_REV_8_21_14_020_66_15]|nr:MAG: hypothetical protein COW30_14730 [Rhodospirillales bacterium CG15_BIG_FIL_POST_REV_8_21_14_020_66_15]
MEVTAQSPGDGLIVRKSDFGATKTIDRLGIALTRAGITVFARLKHHEGAKKVGMDLRPTELIVFGSPKLGTPLMQSNQAIGLDLPLRAVAWEDAAGTTYLAYTDPGALKARYGIGDRDPVFEKMADALRKFTSMAATKGGLPKQ